MLTGEFFCRDKQGIGNISDKLVCFLEKVNASERLLYKWHFSEKHILKT